MSALWVADIGNRYLKIGEVIDGVMRPRHVLPITETAVDCPTGCGGFSIIRNG